MKKMTASLFVLVLLIPLVGLTNDDDEWPREIKSEKKLVVIYQPQIDSVEGDKLAGRAAVSVTPKGQSEPIFGAVWLEARMHTDLDTRKVSLSEIIVPRVRFADTTDEQQKELAAMIAKEMPTWDLSISLDRLTAMLEIADNRNLNSGGFDDNPPKIIFTDVPSILVTIDGEPKLRDIEETGVQTVVNSPFLIAQDPKKKDRYYLYAGSDTWYQAPSVMGLWQVVKKVPKKVAKLQPEDEETNPEDEADKPKSMPEIVVATEPTELIVSDRQPMYAPLGEGDLLVLTNTESDVLIEVASQRTFVLLSGRWFAAKSTAGPWSFVPSDELPEAFAKIDPDSEYGHLLTFVAGTGPAEEAVFDAAVPQTAAIKRAATITVTYDGNPDFKPIEGTSLYYAVNTQSQVVQDSSGTYYCAEDAVWYVSSKAMGPWSVATKIPDEIYTIPPSSSLYNITHLYVYDETPEVVYVGYYPGYTNSYIYHGCVVYGTGWYYRPYWGHRHYYPRYSTWGFHMRWNPWHGWGFGFSYSTGPFTFSIGRGGWYRRGWWGPRGHRGYRRGYNRGYNRGYRSGRRSGYNSGYRAAKRDTGRNMYQNKNNKSKVSNTGATRGAQNARSSGAANQRSNNVYTDKSGNVYRRQNDGNWQKRDGGSWSNTTMQDSAKSRGESAAGQRSGTGGQKPSGASTSQRPSGTQGGTLSGGNLQGRQGSTSTSGGSSAQRPSGSTAGRSSGSYSGRTSSPPKSTGSSSVNRSYQSRQSGSQRSSSYRSSGGSRGGGSRGGGGGRR